MKYIAHLTQGGTVELELPETLDGIASRTPVFRGVPGTWLADDHGATVNMERVSALVPVPAAPVYVIDGEGDRWVREEDGQYRFQGQSGLGEAYSLAYIERVWGIKERG